MEIGRYRAISSSNIAAFHRPPGPVITVIRIKLGDISLAPLAIFLALAHNEVAQPRFSLGFPGGLLMSQADEIRLEAKVSIRHPDGRPFHYPSLSQDDRIRRVFALPEDAPLPSVTEQALAVYYDHLVVSLALPFEALFCPTGGDDMRQLIHYVRVTELVDPRQGHQHNLHLHGLYCKAQNAKQSLDHLALADLGVREDNPNCQLIDDYAYWFVNCH
jgi:hypothetical protein